MPDVPCADLSCTPHATLNQCRCVVFYREILLYFKEKLLREMKDAVIVVHQFQKKVDWVLTPTPPLPLIFNRMVLSEEVHCAWYRLQVKTYAPNPLPYFYS